jgi:hypothetical protein
MRGSIVWPLVALAVWTSTAPAAGATAPTGQPTAPTGAAPSGPQYSTRVEGTVPDLTGRWLALTQVKPPQGGPTVYTVVQRWEVVTVDGKPQVDVRFVKLTPALDEQLTAANKDGRAWEPDVGQLQELRDAWSALPPDDRGAATVETVVMGKDAFPDAAKTDEQMKGAEFLIQISIGYNPGAERPIRDVLLYGVTGPERFGYRGNYASVTVAAAPVPIPIALKGTFRLYRLESVQGPGLLQRILGIFAGCGRRTRDGDTAR